MDDFNVSSLHESKNEWGARLLTILTPLIIEGFKSIFDESVTLCRTNNEMDKYLMTFQNLITRIPKWNATIIETERKRIIEKSCCNYLEELVTCVHIIQLKLLTAMRVGQKQKKIDINIPKLDDFIHKSYVNVARKVYKNVYLFEISTVPLQVQKHNRELEIIVQECILNAVRESIPIESILRAYMDETVEEDVIEEIKEQVVEKSAPENARGESEFISEVKAKDKEAQIIKQAEEAQALKNTGSSSLKFNDVDAVLNDNNKEEFVNAPKSLDRLEEISKMRNEQRKKDEEDDEVLKISDQDVELGSLDVHIIGQPEVKLDDSFLLNDIEILT
uniref:Uncharacterized protein n=1 Tax=viral metagenome TaxID=1070528 RepID=A0A6C0I8L1_9ZZZZ